MQNEFTSSDLAFSAYLVLKGVELLRLVRLSPSRVGFVFADSDLRVSLSQTYLTDGSKVDPVKYLQSIYMLKGMAACFGEKELLT